MALLWTALLAAGAILLAVVALVLAAYVVIFRRPLPRTMGELVVDGLDAVVEIVRDQHGVPHVGAASRRDAAFAVGFLHGQERLWQMEMQRRLAAGRLSEVIGVRGLPSDRLMRRLGLYRVAEAEWHVTHVASPLRPLLLAYADGVNAAVRDRPLPAEFTILSHRPEPWRPEDSIAAGRLLGFSQSGNWEAQLIRARLLKEVGPEVMAALEPRYPPGHPVLRGRSYPVAASPGSPSAAVPAGDAATAVDAAGLAAAADELLAELAAADDILQLSSWSAASNSWAVTGARSAAAGPLLANDPHSVVGIPSPWYQVHVATPEDEVTGLSFCGSPFVVIGHNRQIAWGLVNSGVSIQELYVERLNPHNPLQFDDLGGWRDAVRFREVIRVRGAKPVVEDVLVTRRGPVIGPAIPGRQPPLSLRWVGNDAEVDSHSWVMLLNQARDWRTFRAAVGSIASPSLIVTYADVTGNIGFRLAGFVPIRRRGQGLLPGRGWAEADEWQGFVPFEEMPESLNPPEGIVVAANNPLAPDACPYPLWIEPSSGYRAARLWQALGDGPVSLADSVALQADVLSLPGLDLRALVLDRLGGEPPVGAADLALGLQVLRAWDGRMEPGSAGGAVYARLMATLMERVIGAHLSPAARGYLLGGSVHDLFPQGPFGSRLVPNALAMLRVGQLAPAGELDPAGRDALLGTALAEVVAALRADRGADPARWRWGDEEPLRLEHPLAAAFRPLAAILSRGPFPRRGDSDTVHLTGRAAGRGVLAAASSAIWRGVYDLSDWGRSVAGHAPGQSGHPASPHYADMIPDWLAARPRPLPFGDGPPDAGRRLVLRPRGDKGKS